MTIRSRVFLLTILGVAGASGLTALGCFQLQHAAGDGGQALLGSAKSIREQMQADMMHDALRADVLSALVASNAEDRKAVDDDLDEHCRSFKESLDALTAGNLNADSRNAVTSARPALEAYINSARGIISQAATDKGKASAMLPAFRTAFSDLETRMEAIGDTLAADAAAVQKEGDEMQRTAMRSLMLIGGISVAVMSLAGFMIARSITRPMKKLVDTMQDMASGSRDLTQRVDDQRKDELGQLGKAFNTFVTDLNESNAKAREASERIEADAMTLQNKVEQMLTVTDAAGNGDFTVTVPVTGDDAIGRLAEGFRKMLARISDLIRQTASGAVQIDAGAQQIAGASQALASGASQQAASLEEISASLEEITSMTNQNADNAQQASGLSAEAQKSADKGKDQTGKLSDAMKQIQESADKVSAIIKTIDDIAFQTNLLALNAAVEAARAGEAGKGFAVVAEEVRNLAQRSAEAAKNTAALITESKSRADTGVSIALGVGKALEEIVAGSSKVNTLLNEIASASREQAQGVAQVNKGVTELDKVTQQNAGNSEELASAAEETASQVACLRELVGRFKVEDTGPAAPASAAAATNQGRARIARPAAARRGTATGARTSAPAAHASNHAPSEPPVAAETASARTAPAKHAIPFDDDHESFEKF